MIARARRTATFTAFASALSIVSISAAPAVTFAETAAELKKLQADVKKRLDAGDKAAKAKDWATALSEYTAANGIASSPKTLAGMGEALFQQGKLPEAYDVFSELVKSYGTALKGGEKSAIEARYKELRERTGYISIRVNEAGATVSVDDKSIGASPVPALIRIVVGPHKVAVSKDGFVPFEQVSSVQPDGKDVVNVLLVREAKMGRLVVKEKTGQPIRVLLDGVDVGAAPWESDVEPGRHEIGGRGANLVAPKAVVELQRGKSAEVDLEATAVIARLEIKTSDGKGLVSLDGKPVAEGSYAGEVTVGPHVIEVTRDGFERFKKSVTLADKQTMVESVTLKSDAAATAPKTPRVESERLFEGIYGGFALLGAVEPSNSGNEIQTRCLELGATSCVAPKPTGGGAFTYIGYSFNPVGFELMVGGLVDQTQPKAKFEASFDPTQAPNVNLATAFPRREESFILLRAGGIGALQARYTANSRFLRVSLAAGVGAAYKVLSFKRSARSIEPGEVAGVSEFIPTPKTASYFSPAITLDGSVSIRFSGSLALAIGGVLWVENAGGSTASKAAKTGFGTYLVQSATALPKPIPTPSYIEASGPQVFIGPYVGLQFGP